MTHATAIDANVLVRFLTRDDPVKADRVLALFRRAIMAAEWYEVLPITLAEVVWVLESHYAWSRSAVTRKLSPLLDMPPLHFQDGEVLREALILHAERNVDFIDGYLAALLLRRPEPVICSYDVDFDRIPGIRRIEP